MCIWAILYIKSLALYLAILYLNFFIFQELKTPMFKGIVVAGEASESESDDEINTTDVNTSLPPLKGKL